MERLVQRTTVAKKALVTLQEVLMISSPTKIERDAAIQRFEYTFEAVWKAAKQYLLDVEGIDIGSPKGVVRSSMSVGLLDENEATTGLEMVDDRNQTVHTYNESVADMIFNKIPLYATLMGGWLERIQERSEAQ